MVDDHVAHSHTADEAGFVLRVLREHRGVAFAHLAETFLRHGAIQIADDAILGEARAIGFEVLRVVRVELRLDDIDGAHVRGPKRSAMAATRALCRSFSNGPVPGAKRRPNSTRPPTTTAVTT